MNLFNPTSAPFGFAAMGQANAQPYGATPQAPQAGQMSAFGQQPQDPNMAAMANQRAMFDAQRLGSQNPPMPNMAYMQGQPAQPMGMGQPAQDPNMAAMAYQRMLSDMQGLNQNPPMPNMAYMQGQAAQQPMLQGSLAAPGGGMPPMTQSDLMAMMRASSPMSAPGSLSAASAGNLQGVMPLGSSMPGTAPSMARPVTLPDFSGLRGLRARQEMTMGRARGKRGRG